MNKFKLVPRWTDSLEGRAILSILMTVSENPQEIVRIFGNGNNLSNPLEINFQINGITVDFSALVKNLHNDIDFMVAQKAKEMFQEKYREALAGCSISNF